MGEQVTVVIRREPNMKPNDTRCKANIAELRVDKNGDPEVDDKGVRVYNEEVRCENEISYDAVSDGWSDFCEQHTKQNDKARADGLERVAKVTRVEAAAGASEEG